MSQIQFRPNKFFLSLTLSVIRCLDLVRKCRKKKHQNIFKKDHDPDPVFFCHPDLDPKKMDRIRNNAFNQI